MRSLTYLKIVAIPSVICLITGCMVGPNFHSPKAPTVDSYNAKKLPIKTVQIAKAGKASKAQTFVAAMDIPAQWWELFHSEPLNNLIKTGLTNSPNLAAAYASLRVAQETLNAQIGNSLFPAFDATGAFSRARSPSTGTNIGPTSIFNVYNTSVNVSYTLDVFGGARRQIESLQAQVDNQQFELIAAYLTLTSNIVTTAITAASLEAQINATIDLINAQQNQLVILQNQYRLGGVSQENVLTQETLVEQTRATLPALQKSLSQSRHALSVLVGHFPNNAPPDIKLDDLSLPTKLPVSLPSELVRQRPDVRAAEALLHAASAQIGVATANLLPQFNLTGNYGWLSPTTSQLFGTATKTWTIGTQLTQPLFHGGALFATRRAAIAAFDQAQAQYRQTVLQAFQNTADSLRALETDARALKAQRKAEIAAYQNLVISQKQYKLGGASYLFVLNAQQQYQTAKIARIQAAALRYSDTAALFQALGGGWWHQSWCVKECLHDA